MTGLLRKDVKVLLRSTRRGTIWIYLLLGAMNVYLFKQRAVPALAAMFSMLIAINVQSAIALDDGTGWKKMELTLPLSIAQRVLPKYLLVLVYLAAASVLLAAVALAEQLIYHTGVEQILPALALLWGLTLTYSGLSIPVMYRFGSQARLILMLLIILPSSFLMGDLQVASRLAQLMHSPHSLLLLALGAPATVLLLFGLSFFISQRMYRTRIG